MIQLFWTAFIAMLPFFGYNTTENNSALHGKVYEEANGEGIPFAAIQVKQGETVIAAGESDFDGSYYISNIPAGTYDVHCSYVGFNPMVVTSVILRVGGATKLDLVFANNESGTSGIDLETITVIDYKIPLIEQGNSGLTLGAEDIANMASRSVNGVANAGSRVTQKDKGAETAAGSRTSSNDTYVDGARVTWEDFNKIGKKNNKKADKKPEEIITEEETPPLPPKVKSGENVVVMTREQPLSTFSIDVDNASYTQIRNTIRAGKQPSESIVRLEEMVNYFKYDYPIPDASKTFDVFTELSDCPWNSKVRLLHIGIQGGDVVAPPIPTPQGQAKFAANVAAEAQAEASNNYVFLLDVSGSMSGSSIALVKNAVVEMVDKMDANDQIAVVTYADSVTLELPPTKGSDKEKIKAAVLKLATKGSTAGGAAVQLAYQIAHEHYLEGGNNRVILATDGDFNVGVSNVTGLGHLIEKERETGVFLTVLGVGDYNNDAIMETLADKGNGAYFFIDNDAEARRLIAMAGTLKTIAKDVKLQLEFDSSAVLSYRLVGYENRKLANEDFANDLKDAGELGARHSVTALYELQLQPNINPTDTLLRLHIRYKSPTDSVSQLLQYSVVNQYKSLDQASGNLGWAAAVTGWGMMLRHSRYIKNKFDVDAVLELAGKHLGATHTEERTDFVALVKEWRLLK